MKGSANTKFNMKLAFNGNKNNYESQIQFNNINKLSYKFFAVYYSITIFKIVL